jgi:hypothetical protein
MTCILFDCNRLWEHKGSIQQAICTHKQFGMHDAPTDSFSSSSVPFCCDVQDLKSPNILVDGELPSHDGAGFTHLNAACFGVVAAPFQLRKAMRHDGCVCIVPQTSGE